MRERVNSLGQAANAAKIRERAEERKVLNALRHKFNNV